MHSVFEDWDDDAASANTYASAVILVDDGAQTVVIPPESAFYLPPSPIKPFGYVFDDDEPLEAADSEDIDKVPSVTLTPPNTSAVKGFARDRDSHILNLKGLVLHINTAFYPSAETPLTSMFSTSAPRVSDDASWAPKCKPGPDVPLDCICTGDIQPIGRGLGGGGYAVSHMSHLQSWLILSNAVLVPHSRPAFLSAPCF